MKNRKLKLNNGKPSRNNKNSTLKNGKFIFHNGNIGKPILYIEKGTLNYRKNNIG